jgi:hypothetical protein
MLEVLPMPCGCLGRILSRRISEDLHAPRPLVAAPEPAGVQELLPLPLACLGTEGREALKMNREPALTLAITRNQGESSHRAAIVISAASVW